MENIYPSGFFLGIVLIKATDFGMVCYYLSDDTLLCINIVSLPFTLRGRNFVRIYILFYFYFF